MFMTLVKLITFVPLPKFKSWIRPWYATFLLSVVREYLYIGCCRMQTFFFSSFFLKNLSQVCLMPLSEWNSISLLTLKLTMVLYHLNSLSSPCVLWGCKLSATSYDFDQSFHSPNLLLHTQNVWHQQTAEMS